MLFNKLELIGFAIGIVLMIVNFNSFLKVQRELKDMDI